MKERLPDALTDHEAWADLAESILAHLGGHRGIESLDAHNARLKLHAIRVQLHAALGEVVTDR